MISSGKSSLDTVNILREANLSVNGVISIFNYGFETAKKNFAHSNCEYFSLCDYEVLLNEAIKSQYINSSDMQILQDWQANPSNWKK